MDRDMARWPFNIRAHVCRPQYYDRCIVVREADSIRTASSVGDSWRSYENVAHYCRRTFNGSAARRSSRFRDLRYRERAHVEGNGDGVDLGRSSLFPEILREG